MGTLARFPSSGNRRVIALINRKFSSAAVVSTEASHNHAATMRRNAPTSAAALKVPRPIHLAMSSALPFTLDERLEQRLSSVQGL